MSVNGQPMMFPPNMICYCCNINCSPNGVPQYRPAPVTPVPVAQGEWAQWGEWSACEDNFGVTSQTRRRTCIGGNCPGGEFEQARRCLQTPQQDEPPANQNTWSDWSNWSSCSKSCGPNNFRTRARHCKCSNAVSLDDCVCIGDSTERQDCPTVPCCVHSPWSEWSLCSTTCGPNGMRQRVRTCSCAEGPDCDALGAKIEQQPCAFSVPCTPLRDETVPVVPSVPCVNCAPTVPCANCAQSDGSTIQCVNCAPVQAPTVPCVNCNSVCSYCPVGYTQPCYTCLSKKKREALLKEKVVIS
ncbi:unnamed protein product [Bursaphelenchus okinawaensis]|uniref:Thrombospondin type 1 domain protein n=1 Tax=Bursaphelenchus okinawaensis TaxID=465554 RepID=A0A811LWD9_9BILA|nr:unnamed protein product [Bursaphelenchus okinawaensis]CAG9128353.1 unnamed protein product [Bursaphelenchus okinawaensis]